MVCNVWEYIWYLSITFPKIMADLGSTGPAVAFNLSMSPCLRDRCDSRTQGFVRVKKIIHVKLLDSAWLIVCNHT